MTPQSPGARRTDGRKPATEATGGTGATPRIIRLLGEAQHIIGQIRDGNPADLHYHLDHKGDAELIDLVRVLAAMVPVDRSPGQLLAWTVPPEETAGLIAEVRDTMAGAHPAWTGGTPEEARYRQVLADKRRARKAAS